MSTKKQRVAKLLTQPLEKHAKIAFICSFCLGDSLMGMVTVNNLINNGHVVDVYGDYAFGLRQWFPQLNIHPLITVQTQETLKEYDVVLHMYQSDLSEQMSHWHPFSVTLSDSMFYLAKMSMTDIQVALCEKEFALPKVTRINNIQPLAGLEFRKHKNRIIFHPTSSLLRKNWPPSKFLSLAKQLREEGFECFFIVSPAERPDWEWLQTQNLQLPKFNSLSDVAKFIYESGYFIGNDSGIGHLASNLGIPTLSIILRKSVARQWRPTWAPGVVVLSPKWLNPRPLKEKFWKIFTTVRAVKKSFDGLRVQVEEI